VKMPALGDTPRRFAFEITAITAGILVALSIDAIVERNRERALVAQARAAIAREVADNRQELDNGFAGFEKHQADLRQALRFADELLRSGKTDLHSLNLGFSFPSLNRAAWQTADRTGALSYMDYDEVKEYSELYELQDLVITSQRQLLAQLSGLLALLSAGEGGDPMKSSSPDLQVFRSRLLDALGATGIHQSMARTLSGAYREMEESREPKTENRQLF
jgi:hypothetical protein